MDNEQLLEHLVDALQLLAADYETQVNSLPAFVHVPDELALTYNNCFLLVDQLIEHGLINELQKVKLEALDATLDHMSEQGSEELWTLDALESHCCWQKIRSQATELLYLFGRQKQRPDLSWIEYVSGAA